MKIIPYSNSNFVKSLFVFVVPFFLLNISYSNPVYTKNFRLESAASVLYDISVFHKENMIAFNLETRKLSVEFKSATQDQVFRQLILTETYTPFKANSYKAFYQRTKKLPPLRKKRDSLAPILSSKKYASFSASYKDVEIYLILEKILTVMKFPCLLSNKIYGNITLNLDQANSLEVLAYIMDDYNLTFLQLDGSCLIKPIPGTY